MLSFDSDYIEGAHPAILAKLVETNLEQLPGYGLDRYSLSAKEKIREACKCPGAQISFLAGGTQTNQLVIDSLLEPYEGVVAASTGHISVHEAGAIEYTGHKVIVLPQHLGKIDAEELRALMERFYSDDTHEHMVRPGMIYISHPTEYGTLYSAAELKAVSSVCREYGMPLYLDGARLGYGLMSRDTDVSLPLVAELCDVFYIGGTKVGALIGEALVFTRGNEPSHFMTRIKQHGALLAKGRIAGIQFDVLFGDGLYFEISRHAIDMAELLKTGLKEKGMRFLIDSPTNQQFVILENSVKDELAKHVSFSFWEIVDGHHTAVRFATSWATPRENIEKLLELL